MARRERQDRPRVGCGQRGHRVCADCWPAPMCVCNRQMARVRGADGTLSFVCRACAEPGQAEPQPTEPPAEPMQASPSVTLVSKPAPVAKPPPPPPDEFPNGF